MKKILVIEDTTSIREEIMMTLQFEDFEAIGAEDGRTGVQLAQNHLPNLIICDIMMPELDGFGVLRELRQSPQTETIPVIFLTARADKSDLRQGMELGADDYLTKPFTASELIAAINTQLEKKATWAKNAQNRLDGLRASISYALPHELLTPLNSIIGFSEMIVEDCESMETDEIVELTQTIHKNGLRLNRLVENFLVFTQVELAGKDPEKIAAFRNDRTSNPKEIICTISKKQAEAANRENDLKLAIDNASIRISEDNLSKIVFELVDNAFKFSKEGAPVLLETLVNSGSFRLCVTDHGRGMTPEHIAEVGAYMQFERRFHEQQGAGLGLAIAKRLTELHDGQLTMESTTGGRTKVCVTLPTS